MSGVAHAVGKVFKGVVGIVKKVWKPLAIAAAVYFTGGAALGAMGAMSTGGGLLAGAGAGLEAAAGGIGIGTGAGIGSAFAAGAGTLGDAAAIGGSMAGTAAADAVGGFSTDAAAGAAGAGDAVTGVASGLTDAATYANPLGASIGTDTASVAANGVPGFSAASMGMPSPLWGSALSTAGKILGTPGVAQGLFGMLQGIGQAQMFNQSLKWQEAHAPGQITGGVKDAFGNFAQNPNMQGSPVPQGIGRLATANTPTPTPSTSSSPTFGSPYDVTKLPGFHSPTAESAGMQGYGMPGYGLQPMGGAVPPSGPGLLSGGPPFMENPYEYQDQSYG